MRTNVHLPKSIKKFFSVYSISIVTIGLILVVLYSLHNVESIDTSVDAYSTSYGDILNICGAACPAKIDDWDTRNATCGYDSQYRCDQDACNGRKNSSEQDPTDCYVAIYRCEPGEEEYVGDCPVCNVNRDKHGYDYVSYSDIFNNNIDPYHHSSLPTDCLMIQIDLVCDNRGVDWVVWRGSRWNDPSCKNQPTPSYQMRKEVVGPLIYDEGETVQFNIIIENTGNVVIDNMAFSDEYDSQYIRFLDINATKVDLDGNVVENVSWDELSKYINPTYPQGEFHIDDLTLILGNLKQNEKYIIEENFISLTVVEYEDEVCNYAITYWDRVGDLEDRACISIKPEEKPPTDR